MIRPFGNRLLVKPDPKEDIKKGLLWVPDVARSKPQEGVVVAIGSGVTTVEVGSRVLFGRYAASEVQIEGAQYLILREPDVLGVLI